MNTHEIAEGRRVFIDCREAIGEAFPEEFPTVYRSCQAAGIDPADMRPQIPA